MFDAWMGDCLMLLAIPTYMAFAVQRIRPRLLSGDGILLEDLEILQVEYRKRYRARLLPLRVAPALLAVYFVFRIVLWPPDVKADGPSLDSLLIAAFAVYIGSMVGTIVLRICQQRDFIVAHPIFEDSFLPVRPRVFAMAPWVLSLGILITSFVVEDKATQITLLILGFVGIFIGTKLRYRQISHSRYELPWDEPLGKKISEVVEQFGHTPKKLVLLPSLVANAGATPDGTVVVTSALRTIATPSEIAAVVAHELSHVRDGEGKKWVRLRMISMAPVGALGGFLVVIGQGTPAETFIPPLVAFGLITLSMVPAWWVSLRTQPAEFKCDADAAKLGLGLELASCLNKITRFMGQPPRWIGIDRFLITHPSLEERTARLFDAAKASAKSQDISSPLTQSEAP